MKRFGLILLAIVITAIGVTVTSLVRTGSASAGGNGELTFVEFHKDGVDGVDGLLAAISVTVSPDGKHLYAAGAGDDAVAVFSRDSATGELTFMEVHKDGVGGVDGLDGARSVTVSPDGKHIYTASWVDSAVAVFSRNSTTGELTFVEVMKDGVGGVDGLWGARSVTVSPDGKHVYTASWVDSAVAIFSRDSTTGELTFVGFEKDGVGGVDGLFGAFWVAVSPDGKHIYAAGKGDDAVAVFSRNSTTGELTVVEFVKDGVGGVDGLDGAYSVTVSPDGKHVYVAASVDDAVAVFSRNWTTGELNFVEFQKDGVGGIDGLDDARSVTVSPDGKHVYVAGARDDAVAVFSRSTTIQSADLEVVKTGSPDPVIAGANLTYVITVTNSSTSTTATNVQVKDKLPPGTSLISAVATGGSCTGSPEVTCTFGSLAPGASAVATIVVKVNDGTSGPLTNVATTTSDTLDSVISNNSFKAVTQVTPSTPFPSYCRYDANDSGTTERVEAVAAVTDYLLQLPGGDPEQIPTRQDAVDVVTAYLLQLSFTCP